MRSDIDLAVQGLPPESFFRTYAEGRGHDPPSSST